MKTNTIRVPRAMWLLFLAYFAVTAVGVAHTVVNALVFDMSAPDTIRTVYDYPAYAATIAFHPLYNIVLWPLFAVLYFKATKPENAMKADLPLGLLWCIIALAIDVLGWVIIPHPFSMTWKEFFVDYQPWITLIYLTIFISPFIGAFFYRRRVKGGVQ